MQKIEYDIEPWQKELFAPHRYKIIYGGRGSGKSYAVADALLLISTTKKCLILCGREFQNSIRDSVHSLLRQRIEALELREEFEISYDEIRHISTNSRFIFKGLRMNIDSIKSMAGITHLWIEEADTLSKSSWDVIRPTIRENESEIWATLNPKYKTDILYKEFIDSQKLDNAYIVKVNWDSNRFFPEVLKDEMEKDKLKDYELYRHIWEGECLLNSNAQIFKGKWRVGVDSEFFVDGLEPYGTQKYFGLDFGFSQDPTAGIRCYIHNNKLYITHEAVKIGLEIDETGEFLESYLPQLRTHYIYADNSRPESISLIKRQGYNVIAVEKGKGSVEDGIAYIRSFDEIIVHQRCIETIKELTLYSYKVDERSGDITNYIVDQYNHCMDALRYALEKCMKRSAITYNSYTNTEVARF